MRNIDIKDIVNTMDNADSFSIFFVGDSITEGAPHRLMKQRTLPMLPRDLQKNTKISALSVTTVSAIQQRTGHFCRY